MIPFDKLLPFILGNLDKPIIYTLTSLITEYLLFRIAVREKGYLKMILISNLISTPLAWFSLTIIFLPLTYTALITTTQIVTLSEWQTISMIYASLFVVIYILFTSFIEYLVAESMKTDGGRIVGILIISNFISFTVILSILSL